VLAVMVFFFVRRAMVVKRLVELLGDLHGKTIGLLGLSFKPNTDDMRDAPSITISESLVAKGAIVRGYDPVAMDIARPLMPEVEMCVNPYIMAEGCDALIVVTEWNEFKQLDLVQIRNSMLQPVVLDGRNLYDPEAMKNLGFHYRGLGRGYNGSKFSIQPESIAAKV
jgi:UDPglucose 6-dehydrogenase